MGKEIVSALQSHMQAHKTTYHTLAVLTLRASLQGALPYAFAKAGMKAKVYATLPVLKMGQLTLYDMVQSRVDKEDFDVFTLAEIDSAWDHFVQLR